MTSVALADRTSRWG